MKKLGANNYIIASLDDIALNLVVMFPNSTILFLFLMQSCSFKLCLS